MGKEVNRVTGYRYGRSMRSNRATSWKMGILNEYFVILAKIDKKTPYGDLKKFVKNRKIILSSEKFVWGIFRVCSFHL